MPAQKRGPDPHESQPKLRKLDEDGEALPSTIGPAANSLKTGQNREMTSAAPRTKIKRPSSAEGENKPAKSSKQSSPPKDSCKTASDPPLQKAKLLKSTSASCGEAPSQRANSKACPKRTASTESDDDLSSDGSKVDYFKERDDEDKARCIRKYSNKAKRKAEESSSDPQETSQGLSSEPADPVQIDHNYGRFSDSTSPQSTDDPNEKISSAVPLSEQGKQEISHNATEKVSTDTSESELESTKASVEIESAAEASKHIELKVVESLLDNKVSASTGEVLNTVTPVGEENEKKDQAESIRSQKDVDNETLASSEETLCSVIEEVTSSGNGERPADEKTDLTFISESPTRLDSQSVSEENNLSIKCKTTLDTPGKPDEVLLNETHSAPDQVEISIPKIQIEENVTSGSAAISETRMELKVQVSSEEEFNAADTVVDLCDDVNKILEKSEETLEESDRDGVDFHRPTACPQPLVEVQLNHGFATPDSCTDTSPECKDGHEENQTEMLSIKNVVPEDQMTPEVDLQSQENHLAHDSVAKIAAEFKEELANIDHDMIIHSSAAPDTQIQEDAQVFNPDVTEETQSQELHESTTNLSTEFYEDNLGENLIENKETVNTECENLETQTLVASETSDPGPPVEIQNQEIQEVSESITVTSTEVHYDVTADKCENMGSLECAVTAEGQSTMEKQTIAAFELSDPEANVKLQIPEGLVSECITVIPCEDLKELETANSMISEDAECVVATAESLTGGEKQTAGMSEETCDMTRIEEVHIQMNQVVSEHTADLHDEALNVLENENCDAQSRTEHVKTAATSEEAYNVTEEMEELQTQMVSEPTTNMSNKAQNILEKETFKMSEDVESVSAAQSQTEVDDEAKTTLDIIHNVAPIEEIESQMISEPFTDTPDEAHKDSENANFDVSIKMEDRVQVEITSEEASSVTSTEEMQIQMVSEPTTDIPDETHTDLENSTFQSSEDVTSASAAKSPAEVNEEAKTTLDDVSSVPPTEEIQSQMVSEPDEAHNDLEDSNWDFSTQIEDQVQAEITSEEESKVTSIEEMQTQVVSEPTADTPDETHKDLEDSTFHSSEDACISVAAQSQTDVDEGAKVTYFAPVEEMQTQVVSEPITDISVELAENHREEKLKTVGINEMKLESVTSQLEVDATLTMERSNPASAVEVEESQTEVGTQEAENSSNPVFVIGIQTQTIGEVGGKITDNSSEEIHDNMVENSQNAKNEDKINSEYLTEQKDETQSEMQITSASEIPEAATLVDMQSGKKTNEMQNTTSVQDSDIPVEEIQNQRSQEIREQVKDTQSVNAAECQNKMETSEFSAETLIQKSLVVTEPNVFEQESFSIPSEESHENENKITEECIDVAERPNEMEVQTTELLEEISQPTTPEQTQFQRGQKVSELTTDTEISAETQIQKSLEMTENVQDLSEQVEESFRIPTDECEENEDKATEECVSITERTNEMELTEAHKEISQPTTTKQAQSQRGQEVSELTTNTAVESDSVSAASEQSLNSANHPITDTQLPVTPGEIYHHKSDVALQNQGNKEVAEGGNDEDEAASECENVPAIIMKPSAETEIFYPAAASEYQNHLAEESIKHTTSDIQTPLPFVHLENKDRGRQTEPEEVQGDVDVISGPIERGDSELEEDTSRQIINEVKVDRPGSKIEGAAESSEVIVFACDQTDDVNVQAPQEQIKHQSEFHDNQVVYEPISSPESNSGGDICTTMELGETISFLDLQNTQTHHTLGDESNFLTNNDRLEAGPPKLDEEIVKGEICVPESQAAAEMEVDTISEAQLEQSNTLKDVKEVAEVSSTDDISVADGRSEDAAEKSEIPECISAAEVTEQVQEDAGLQDPAGIVVATTPPNEVGITDGSSEEYVILEPISENEIHFDIVTQAAAESGLSASLCPDDVSVGDVANESVLNDSQQSGLLEAEVQECETADGVKDPILTSSGDVLDQEMETNVPQDAQNSDHQPSVNIDITNSHSQHTTEDTNAAVIEDKCNLDLQQVQILQDIEIGHEIIVAEEENEEDGDVIIKKSPDQPTDDPPKQSDENINDKSKQKTIKATKQNKTAEKTEDEKKVQEVVKPKKQEMNTQARTKARLAALAEQKAAASKRSANRQQLNLLALCQEIAEDIATDSMLLKKIEEEKQAAAAAEAAKAEASKKELPPTDSQEADPVTIATPAGPEENSASVTPAPEPSAAQPSTVEDQTETQPAADPPKRRFFISQISVPLKAHEKKKLTRYQRLRQVELQREKMSWARVKKLKSDQANQMFSDVDWQASFSGGYLMSPATPPPAPSPPKTSPTSPAATSQPAQPKVEPMPEAPKIEPVKSEPSEPEPIKTENSEPEPPKPENVKTELNETELTKTVPVKAEAPKTEPPHQENRRTTRQSKAQASQAAAAPGPAPKVTRSASKKTLPAMPPPMPNGLKAQKPKPVEYKPYRPRPKYSPDDFELDDDDLLLGVPTKLNPPTQPPRPSPQQSPAALSKKIPVSSQPANQTRLKSQAAPPGQTSGQSKPAGAAQAQLKPAQSKPTVTATPPRTTTSSKTAPSASAQSKSPEPVSASGRPKPAASAPPQLKTAGGTKPADSVSSETKPAAAQAGDASVPQKPEHLPSEEQDESQKTADPLSSSLPSVKTSKVSDDTKKCEENPSVTTSHSAPEKNTETAKTKEKTSEKPRQDSEAKPQDAATHLTDASLQKEVKKLKEAEKDTSQTIIDAGQKHFGPVACSMCGMLYSAANPEDESQHLLFHNQFISAVKYVGWKKERILAEYPDGKIILVLPDDPKYALKKVEEIREMVDNDLGFQQVETKCPSQTKTFLFISIDKKVAGCLITEHIQEGYRVIEEPIPEGSEGEKVMFERQRAWCCSTTPEPAVCGISRIWVVSMMRRQGIATRMLECLRNNFIYGSYLSKDEIAFSDPTPDGKLFAMHYFGTSQFLVYNFVSGPRSFQPKTHTV